MSMTAALRDRLQADAGVSALVGTRVLRLQRPQASALPAITIQGIAPGREYTHDGADDLHEAAVQIDCWAASVGAAEAVAAAVIAAVEPSADQDDTTFGPSFLDAQRDMDPEAVSGGTLLYRVSMDFTIYWQPA